MLGVDSLSQSSQLAPICSTHPLSTELYCTRGMLNPSWFSQILFFLLSRTIPVPLAERGMLSAGGAPFVSESVSVASHWPFTLNCVSMPSNGFKSGTISLCMCLCSIMGSWSKTTAPKQRDFCFPIQSRNAIVRWALDSHSNSHLTMKRHPRLDQEYWIGFPLHWAPAHFSF